MSNCSNIAGANLRGDREKNDFYPTPTFATVALLRKEKFGNKVLEPACGDGAMSKVLENHGHSVTSQDLIDRGYGEGGVNFFFYNPQELFDAVITNPPYKSALQFVQKSLSCVKEGGKVAMLLKLVFLESSIRWKFFQEHPPKKIYVFSERLPIYKNGESEGKNSGLIAYAWFVWEKGHKGPPEVGWISRQGED